MLQRIIQDHRFQVRDLAFYPIDRGYPIGADEHANIREVQFHLQRFVTHILRIAF